MRDAQKQQSLEKERNGGLCGYRPDMWAQEFDVGTTSRKPYEQ